MTRTRLLSPLVAILALAVAPSAARAQTQWNGYAPVYAARPVAPAPVQAVRPPVYYYPANPVAWQGYAPGTVWRYYDPAAGWRYYIPAAAPPQQIVSTQPSYRTFSSDTPSSSRNPEYGTGRNVHMIKPWLPPSPR